MTNLNAVSPSQVTLTKTGMRRMSDDLRKSGADAAIGRTSGYNAPWELLFIEEGFNIRDELDMEHAENFCRLYMEGVKLPPIDVEVVEVDGVLRLKVLEGHHRYIGAGMAIEQGFELPHLPVIELNGTPKENLLRMYGSTQGKALSPMEKARFYKRMMDDHGMTQVELAKELNTDRANIATLLTLNKAEPELQRMLSDGEIGSTAAIKMIREHGSAGATVAAKIDADAKVEQPESTESETPKQKKPAGLKLKKVAAKSFTKLADTVTSIDWEAVDAQIKGNDTAEVNVVMTVDMVAAFKEFLSAADEVDAHNQEVEANLAKIKAAQEESEK